MSALEKSRAIAWMHFALAVARRNNNLDVEILAVERRLKSWSFKVD